MQRDGATVNRNKLLSRSWNIQLRQPELAGHYKVISSRGMLSFDHRSTIWIMQHSSGKDQLESKASGLS